MGQLTLASRERLILLNLVPAISSRQLHRLLEAFGHVDRLWAASAQQFQHIEGITLQLAKQLVAACADEERLRRELALAERHGVTVVTLEDAEYPTRLRTIPDPPLALYVRGTLEGLEEAAVAIVGSRHASLYGMQCAERLGSDLASRGVAIISGLARGIDSAAHRGALKASGRTFAVLGSGLARIYPPEHEALAMDVAQHGALLSEYPLETPPLPHHFPRRNRLISGLSLGVVIVEAAKRSGALITADCALEQGRDVFAIPGPITTVTSQGTHELLKQGARLVTSVEDILDELQLHVPAGREDKAAQAAIDTEWLPVPERHVLSCVGEACPQDIDAIAGACGLDMPEVSSALLHLELKRLIRQLPGKRFIRINSAQRNL